MSIFIFIYKVLWEVSHRAPNDLLDNMAECYIGNLSCVSASVLLSARQLHADKQTNKQVKFCEESDNLYESNSWNAVWMVKESSDDHVSTEPSAPKQCK